jgi:hypothetical protein
VLGALCSVAVIAAGWTAPAAGASVLNVSVSATARTRPLPAGFLGLALEYRGISALVDPTQTDVVDPVLVSLVRNLVPRDRPVLRIGGQSSDRTWWPLPGRRPLGITYSLSAAWLRSARALARATDARLILGVGLEAGRSRIDTVEAAHLLSGIGRRYVSALEIGNEPELYTITPWYRLLDGAPVPWYETTGVPVFARGPGYGPGAFAGEFARAAGALPGVPIAGPATGNLSWLGALDSQLSRSSRLRVITWHAYGLNQCVTDPSSPLHPSVPNLLAPAASRSFIDGIAPYVALAHRAGASFRVAEMNSVTCNGRVGVSDTFASALWLLDALFTIAGDGVDGVNIHTFPGAANGLFDFTQTAAGWRGIVHPLYYGALLFAQAAPTGSRLLRIRSGSQDQIRAWATLAPDRRVRVLLINDDLASPALALVRVPVATGAGSLERLRARSAYATAAVTLAGRTFGARTATGVLAPPVAQAVAPRAGVYRVTMPPGSAALLTLPPRRR